MTWTLLVVTLAWTASKPMPHELACNRALAETQVVMAQHPMPNNRLIEARCERAPAEQDPDTLGVVHWRR